MRTSGIIPRVWVVLIALTSAAISVTFLTAEERPADQEVSRDRGTTVSPMIRTGETEFASDPDRPSSFVPILNREPLASYPEPARQDSNWVLLDVDTFHTYIRVGEATAVRFDPSTNSVTVIEPPDPLTLLAGQALEWVPAWLVDELRDAFARMDSAHQDTYATIILNTLDPIVDEVAFVIAHTAPEVLQHANFHTDLITENALDVYAHDPFLDYVDIVDYGSAAGGGDYYSTVVYYTAADRDTNQVELPKERYYWDIVHPKIQDEFPTHIDPATGLAADPPLGRFWREFLFDHADTGYPLLRDAMAGVQTLWEGNVDNLNNGAVGAMTQWILDCLDFGSGAERPIQPVRIYRLHLGRCGEHADITAAAARSCLIATNSPLAIPDDHTWNEFYDRRWVAWEPVNVYVDSPWHYEGWGKSFVGIFSWRGDDWVWTVTDNGYTPWCDLVIAVSDSFGYPLDGAQVTIAKKLADLAFQEVTWSSTDCNGECYFTLGDNHDIYYRIDSDLGTVPPGSLYKPCVEGSEPDSHYFWSKSINNHRPQLPALPAALPPLRQDEYRLKVNWQAVGEFIYGENRMVHNTYCEHPDTGAVEFFVCDETNYGFYTSSDTFYAYEISEDASERDVTFTLPSNNSWYAVLSNEEHVVNSQVVSGTAELYGRTTTSVAAQSDEAALRTHLGRNHPNPFTPETWISYAIGSEGAVELAVFDVTGRRVKTLVSKSMPAGTYRIRWDATNVHGERVAPGVYLCLLDTGETRLTRKMVLVK